MKRQHIYGRQLQDPRTKIHDSNAVCDFSRQDDGLRKRHSILVPGSCSSGFTLIELMISISVMAMMVGAIYFSFDAALESWGYSRNQLSLQKVLSETMNKILNGTPEEYGLWDSLEILVADKDRVDYVPIWTDDAHSTASEGFVYTLNRRLKPGGVVPIAEVRMAESEEWKLRPVRLVPEEDRDQTKVQLGLAVPSGADLRFTYHPDPEDLDDVVHKIFLDSETQQVFLESHHGTVSLSENPFGVEITEIRLVYYGNVNQRISERDDVDFEEVHLITGIEVFLKGRLGSYTQELLSFISLRNAPLRKGVVSLQKDMEIPIPDSDRIHTLTISNVSGVGAGDKIELEAIPEVGKSWRVTLTFARASANKPTLDKYTIDYPPQKVIFFEYPKTNAEIGLDLLSIGVNGLQDYDNDDEIDDLVYLKGPVMLKVTKMDMEGAALIVRP